MNQLLQFVMNILNIKPYYFGSLSRIYFLSILAQLVIGSILVSEVDISNVSENALYFI